MFKKVKKITIISLSKGILGEMFIKHELDIGLKRLSEYGIEVNFSKYALAGLDFISEYPEFRAQDLLRAFQSDTDMILCAVGGDDTYRLLPYLFENNELEKVVTDKIFLGFSDSTMNHFMLHKLGIKSFYGQAFLPDICELANDMLPYTKHYFEQLINTGRISKVVPSDTWYEARNDFSMEAIGTSMNKYQNTGFTLLQGSPRFTGEILGGCIDTIYDMFDNTRYSDSSSLCQKYNLFPDIEKWKGKILLLETSEELVSPDKYRAMIKTLVATGIFDVISGALIGKPVDGKYEEEYWKILKEEINSDVPIVANINVGHCTPRCIIPFGVKAVVDLEKQEISFEY